MNNPKSTVLGWGSLVAAAGVSYYFAKQTINERRAQQAADGSRPTEKLDWRQRVEASSSQHSEGSSTVAQASDNADRKPGGEPSAKATPVVPSGETSAVVRNGVRETN
ncbi:hypothetical protein PHLGIDRAFT_124278 [Phlebiopsis gigantea 11061_1 CR5-6]|uniref:Uncharacterized protein n=1 Tax=Phlebiopsis gigantea (strain 11061_1 CR5-6) TaxID=745531 RepID=A0A0C3PVX8_PHLG1|nr:hypothetical protein PHLGIDRAFT_124278 [Phlebiopsis gigantea 11061_1 CR5-6]